MRIRMPGIISLIIIATLLTIGLLVPGISNFLLPDSKSKSLCVVAVLLSGRTREPKLAGLLEGLQEVGLEPGVDFELVVRNASNDLALLQREAAEITKLHPKIIIAGGGVEADALKTVTHDIPVVFMGVACSRDRGLIRDYRQPGGNLTGIDNFHAELSGKRLEFLKRLIPDIQRVIVLYDPRVSPTRSSLKVVEEDAMKMGIEVTPVMVGDEQQLRKSLSGVGGKYDAIVPLSSFFLEAMRDTLVEISQRERIPVMGLTEEDARSGYLASYGVSYFQQGKQAARLVKKIWYGQNPATIPVESPDNAQLVVNLRAAKFLRRGIAPDALRYATLLIGSESGDQP